MTLQELKDKYINKVVLGVDGKSYKIFNIHTKDDYIYYVAYKRMGQGNFEILYDYILLPPLVNLKFDTVYYLKNRRKELINGRKSKG